MPLNTALLEEKKISINNEEFESSILRSHNTYYVDTISDLKSLAATPKRVFVSGYHSAQDNAFGGSYHELLPDDGTEYVEYGGVIVLAANGRYYKLKHGSVISAEWFGAKGDYRLEDGSVNTSPTDNTSAAQMAIDYIGFAHTAWNPQSLHGGGGKITLGNGSFLITDTVYTCGGLTISGMNKTASSIVFMPTEYKDLFVGDPLKYTRDHLHFESFCCENITVIGDYALGVNAVRAFDFRNFLNPKLDSIAIYNFDIGIEYGLSGYYCLNNDVTMRANFKNVVAKEETGPITFVGGSMSMVNSENLLNTSKIPECYVELHGSAKITFNGTSLETPTDLETTEEFAMIRGDYNNEVDGKIGSYHLNGTYHEGSKYVAEYNINKASSSVCTFNPVTCSSPIFRILDYNTQSKDTSAYPTSKSNILSSTLFGGGKNTGLIANSNLQDGILNGSYSLTQSTEEFIVGIKTLTRTYTSDAPSNFVYYNYIPYADVRKYEGRVLTLTVIDKISSGTYYGLQLYIDGTQQVLKSSNKEKVNYGNGYIKREISTFIPVGNDATELRAIVRINALAGTVYNLAHISIGVDGNEPLLPEIV